MSAKRPFDHFTPVRWRGTTYPTNTEREDLRQVVALSFDTPTGVLRILMDERTADEVGHACAYFREAQRLAQSERSSEIPKPEMSPSDGQLQEPPATSSAATCGET